MLWDAQRFVPALEGTRHRTSIFAMKTVLPRSEVDDSRPILFRPHHGMEGSHVVMGGKIDNVYDAADAIDREILGERPATRAGLPSGHGSQA